VARPTLPASTDLNVVERQTIEHVMRDTGGNKSKAAKRLGLSRTQLYVRLRKYDLEKPEDADLSYLTKRDAASGEIR
jgi:DNA-binding NtrC family response regulator